MASREVKIQSRDNALLFLATTTGSDVCLDTDNDLENQYWIQDARYADEVKDEHGRPGYLLINKATGKALRAGDNREPVQLVEPDFNFRDDNTLWTFGRDEGNGYQAIFPTFNQDIHLNADKGDDEVAQDGTDVIMYDKRTVSQQHWKLLTPEEVCQMREERADYEEAKEELKRNKKATKYAGIGAGLAGAFALYSYHKMKSDPENATRHKIAAGIAGAVAVGAGGYAAYNAYDKERNEDEMEKYEKKTEREEDEKGWF